MKHVRDTSQPQPCLFLSVMAGRRGKPQAPGCPCLGRKALCVFSGPAAVGVTATTYGLAPAQTLSPKHSQPSTASVWGISPSMSLGVKVTYNDCSTASLSIYVLQYLLSVGLGAALSVGCINVYKHYILLLD